MAETTSDIVTAALLIIGDEILSGRTKDKNIGYIADHCTAIGIQLKEVRVVPDEEDEIVSAVNTLRKKYTYLFTTAGWSWGRAPGRHRPRSHPSGRVRAR